MQGSWLPPLLEFVRHEGHQFSSSVWSWPQSLHSPQYQTRIPAGPAPDMSEKFERPRFGAVRAEGHRENLKAFVGDVFHGAVPWPLGEVISIQPIWVDRHGRFRQAAGARLAPGFLTPFES